MPEPQNRPLVPWAEDTEAPKEKANLVPWADQPMSADESAKVIKSGSGVKVPMPPLTPSQRAYRMVRPFIAPVVEGGTMAGGATLGAGLGIVATPTLIANPVTGAASSTITRRYFLPLAASWLSRLQNSSNPPVTNSMRCSCTLRLLVIGANVCTASRHTSESILYVGENHETGNVNVSFVAHLSKPNVVLPARLPTLITLNRFDSLTTCCCHDSRFGSVTLSIDMLNDNSRLAVLRWRSCE